MAGNGTAITLLAAPELKVRPGGDLDINTATFAHAFSDVVNFYILLLVSSESLISVFLLVLLKKITR